MSDDYGIKTINIFLGSSVNDLHDERIEIQSFVQGLNNRYVERGIFIRAYACEETSGAMSEDGSQSVHDRFITDKADATFFMFYTKAGEFTLHELDLARKTFLENKDKPSIFIFFKTVNGEIYDSSEIKAAVDKVTNEYSHYYKIFEISDTVKLEIIQYVIDMVGGKSELLIKDGQVLVDGIAVDGINAEGIFAYHNNPELKRLNSEINELKRKFDEAASKNEHAEVLKYSGLINEKTKEKNELESAILDLYHQFYEKSKSGEKIDPICCEALRLLEYGKADEAIRILPTAEESRAESKVILKKKDAFDESVSADAAVTIERAKTAIKALELSVDDTDRYGKIEERYDSVYKLCKNYDYEMIYDYASFMYDQKSFAKAVIIAEKLRLIYEDRDCAVEESERAEALNLLANLYYETNRYDEAEDLNLEALEISRGLAEKNPDAYLPNVAVSCNNLANLYRETNRYDEAEKLHLEALKICIGLAEKNPEAYLPNVADSCNNLANLYSETNRYDEAEKFYLEALKICKEFAEKNPETYLSDVATSCNNLALLYGDTKRYDKAKELHLEALKIHRGLSEKNPEAYLPNVANSCNNLAVLYSETKQYYEAEELYLKALEIRKGLAEKNPDAYLTDVADSCNNLANLYNGTKRYDEAKELYLEALKIRKEFAEKNPEAYLPDVAVSCNNLANLCKDTKRYDEAEELHLETLEISRKLAEKNPDAYLPDVATSCNNLALLYGDTNRYDEAKELHLEALKIRKEFAEKNPNAYLPDVATSCNNLALLYGDTNRYDEAKELHLEALKIRKEFAEKNPDAYLPDVATSCYNLANLYKDTNRYDEAEELHLEALEIRKGLAEKNPDAYLPDVAASCNNLANLYCDTSRYDEAEEPYLKALNIRREFAEKNPEAYLPDVANSCNNLANLYRETNRYDEAEDLNLEALEIYRKLAEKNPEVYLPDVAVSYIGLALTYKDTGRYAESLEKFTEALEIYQSSQNKNSEMITAIYQSIVMVYRIQMESGEKDAKDFSEKMLSLRRSNDGTDGIDCRSVADMLSESADSDLKNELYEAAEEKYYEAIRLYRSGEADDDGLSLRLLAVYEKLASVLYETDKSEAAEKIYDEFSDVYEGLSESSKNNALPSFAGINETIAQICDDKGDFAGCKEHYEAALGAYGILKEKYSLYRKSFAGVSAFLADMALGKKAYKTAEQHYLNAIEIYRGLAGAESSLKVAYVSFKLGEICRETGMPDEAESFYMESLEIREKSAKKFPDVQMPYVAHIYFSLGKLYEQSKNISHLKAKSMYKKAFEIAENYRDTSRICRVICESVENK